MSNVASITWVSVRAWLPAVSLVIIGYIFEWAGFYKIWPSLDIPMHALGGVLVAYAIHQMLKELPKKFLPKHFTTQGIFVVSLTAMVTIAWETYELFQDILFGTVSQLGIADTIADMWIGIGAAVLYWLFVRYR